MTEKPVYRIRSTIRMLIPLLKQSEVLQILESVGALAKCYSGCIEFSLYRGVDDVRTIMIDELWADEDDFVRHLQSEAYQKVLLSIEMSEETPIVRFDTIMHSSGLETVEKARMPHESLQKPSIL